ncbi:MAG: DUF4837 family protein [Bacteroidales bacterium]|nr:DUF4837 family protein [Candidatus Physcousia equi]
MHYLLLFFLLILTSCTGQGDSSGKSKSRQASIGQPSEVVLIVGNGISGTDVVDSLENLLTANVPGLNQGEDYFRLSRIPSSMDKGEFRKIHSRVLVKLDPNAKHTTLGTANDVYAHPQRQLLISGPSLDQLRSFITAHADDIRQQLLDNQLTMQASYLRTHHSDAMRRDLHALFRRSVDAPEEIQFTKRGTDFLWGSSRTTEKQLNMVFFKAPLPTQTPSDPETLLASLCYTRDSVLQVNIPGDQPDQWMETVWEHDMPLVLVRQCNDTLIELRGLWQMHNGAMGGPFVARCHLNPKTSTLFWTEGFVYSPSTTKRDLVRRLEAALRTFR